MSVRDGVDQGVKVERWEVRVLCLDEYDGGGVVPGEVDVKREGVVEIGERDPVLRTQWLTNDDLVDIIKLIPVLIPAIIKKTREIFQNKIKTRGTEKKNIFFTSHPMSCWSLTSGSNFGPPGIAMLSALAVKNDLRSKR